METLNYLSSAKRQFLYYKSLGEKAMEQLKDEELYWQPNEESNSIVTIVQHMWGNMLSRWTDFLSTDGEKPWRQRDAEFDNEKLDRETILKKWNDGWKCLFDALDSITDADLNKVVLIRNEEHTVLEAINRQLAHYPYHVGQMIYIAKICRNDGWKSLSIPKNKTAEFNAEMFAKGKQ